MEDRTSIEIKTKNEYCLIWINEGIKTGGLTGRYKKHDCPREQMLLVRSHSGSIYGLI